MMYKLRTRTSAFVPVLQLVAKTSEVLHGRHTSTDWICERRVEVERAVGMCV